MTKTVNRLTLWLELLWWVARGRNIEDLTAKYEQEYIQLLHENRHLKAIVKQKEETLND